MNELKAISAGEICDARVYADMPDAILYYRKEEVDRALSAWEGAYSNLLNVDIPRIEKRWKTSDRHHRFKRCKDMAEICYLRFVRYEQYLDSLTSTPETMARWWFLKGHYERWEKRWQDLADKFKGDA